MKSKIYQFDPVIYPFKLLVTKDFDSQELQDMFYCIDDETEELIEGSKVFWPETRTVARTIQVTDKKHQANTCFLILLCHPKLIGTGTIAHEAYHVVSLVSEWLGFLPKKAGEDEPCAYLEQWLANCIERTLKGHPEDMGGTEFCCKE